MGELQLDAFPRCASFADATRGFGVLTTAWTRLGVSGFWPRREGTRGATEFSNVHRVPLLGRRRWDGENGRS